MPFLYLLLLFSSISCRFGKTDKSFNDIRSEYVSGVKKLNLVDLQLNFKENILADKSIQSIKAQIQFFKKIKGEIQLIQPGALNSEELQDYDLMYYQVGLQS